jgi:uncharacterized protein
MPHCEKNPLSLFITSNCNMSCKYCYTQKIRCNKQTIPYSFGKKGIDVYLTPQNPHLRFFGAGEPTLEIELLKKLYNYAFEKIGTSLVTEIQTNGYFGHNTAKWLANHLDIIWLSWDGPADVQNSYRITTGGEPTSHIVEKNAKYLIENSKGVVGVRMTVGAQNVTKQEEAIRYFASKGIKHVWSDPIFRGLNEIEDQSDIDIMQYAKEFIKATHIASELGVNYGSLLTCNFDAKTEYNCRACLSAPHLTTDGYISACDMALFGQLGGPMDCFIYGRWDKDNNDLIYDHDKINHLKTRSASNMKKCQNCEVISYCAGYCLGEIANETGDFFNIKEKVCEAIRFLAKELNVGQLSYKYHHP